jgi:uncharacterized membrane protein
MRAANTFWIVVAIGAIVVLGTLDVLPPSVATHFDGSGTPNGWSSRPGYARFLVAIGVGLPLGIVAIVELFARRAPQWINLPHREIWLAEPHRADGISRVREHIRWLACVLAMTALITHLALLGANMRQPPRLPIGAALGLLAFPLACMVIWAVTWHRLFRPPPGSHR